MGNKLSRGGGADSKFTKPTGLYPSCEWDDKTVKKLINKKKIAPRYPGREESAEDLDECPICFLWYPGGLNRSKCCRQPICTECFLQFKKPNSVKPVQCPFCNAFNYSVKFSGTLSKEEREALEQEEQKVIAAKIRMRKEEEARQAEREKELAEERAKRALEGPTPEEQAAADEYAARRQARARQQAAAAGGGDSPRSRRQYDREMDPDRDYRDRDRERNHYRDRERERGHDGRERERPRHRDRDRERGEGEREHRDRDRERQHRQREQGGEDESGIHMDIEELMVMEAIRLSLLENHQAQEAGEEQEDEEEEEDEEDEEEMEAGAANRHAVFDSEDEEAGAGRRMSDDEEDWPATAVWGEQRATQIREPKTAAFDAALWRVTGEMAQDPLLMDLLQYACAWFDPDAEYRAPIEDVDASPVVMSQSPAVSSTPTAVEPASTLSTTSPAPPMAEPAEEIPAMASLEEAGAALSQEEAEVEQQGVTPEEEPHRADGPGAGENGGSEMDVGAGLADLTDDTVPKMRSEQSESPHWDKSNGRASATNPFGEEEDLTNPFAEGAEAESELLAGISGPSCEEISTDAGNDDSAQKLPGVRRAQGWMEESVSEVEPATNEPESRSLKSDLVGEPSEYLPPDDESKPEGESMPKRKILKSVITSGEDDGICEELVKPKLQDDGVEDVDLIDLGCHSGQEKQSESMHTAATTIQSFSRGMLTRSKLRSETETDTELDSKLQGLAEETGGNGFGNGHNRREAVAGALESAVTE